MKTIFLMLSLVLVGCTTLQIPSYIKSEHPYSKKVYGDYNKIVYAVRDVLVRNGWKIKTITTPTIYERTLEGDENSNILIFTEVKEQSMVLATSYTHLNVLILSIADGAMIEIRYGKLTQMPFKQMRSSRNDQLANAMLGQIEQKMLETK